MSWTAPAGGTPSSYNVYRSTTNNSSYALLASSATNAYTDSTVSNGTTYYFKVTAVIASVETLYSNEISVQPAAPPSAPANLAGVGGHLSVALTWSAPSTGTAPFTYSVFRHTSAGGPYTQIATGLTSTNYTDTGRTNGTTYYYVVKATNSNSTSAYSAEARATPEFVPTVGFDFTSATSFQPHNLFRYSSDLSNALWIPARASTRAVGITAPDGSGLVQATVEDTTTNTHGLDQAVSGIPDNSIVTFSCYIRPGSRAWTRIAVTLKDGLIDWVYFNASTGAIGTVSSARVLTKGIYPVGGGWYRAFFSVNISSGATPATFYLRMAAADNVSSFLGDGASYVYFWGPQLEVNPGVSTYVPTTSVRKASFTTGGLNPTSGSQAISFTRSDAAAISTLYGNNGKIRFAPHNYLTYSEALDNAAWDYLVAGSGTVTANQGTDPAGGSTGEKIDFTSSQYRYQRWNQAAQVLNGMTYTCSMWLWSPTKATIALRISLDTASTDQAVTLASLTSLPTRISVTRTFTTATADQIVCGLDNRVAQGGDGIAGTVYAWGAQLERNSSPSTYVSTTSAAKFGTPRFDSDPLTLEPKGLLSEEARTNSLFYSTAMDAVTAWTPTLATVGANAIESPDGTVSAEKLQETATTGQHFLSSLAYAKAASPESYTYSVYFKSGERTKARIFLISGSNSAYADFDLSTGTVGTPAVTGTFTLPKAQIQSVGNSWYRCSVSGLTGSEATIGGAMILMSGINASYAGTAGSGAYFWGAQLEPGKFSTSLIPTQGAAVTRAAETATIANGSWVNGSVGTLRSEQTTLSTANDTATARFVQQLYVDANNSVGIRENRSTPAVAGAFLVGGSSADTAATAITAGETYKTGLVYEAGNSGVFKNGAAIVTSGFSGFDLSTASMNIGSSGGVNYCGHIRKIYYYNSRLPDADIRRLTQ